MRAKTACCTRLRERIIGPQQLVVHRLRHALMEGQHLLRQLVLGADDQFGRGGRRRRAQVGDKIADREVGLVADGGDDGNLGGGDGARQAFIVEGEEIFERAAAARHDDDIHPAVRLK